MYAAHSSEDGQCIQPLKDHLRKVAEIAGNFAQGFGARSWGETAGLAHDIGKYTPGAQRRILQDGPKVDHSTAGAQEVARFNRALAYCVAGHHAGLADGGAPHDTGESATLSGRLKKRLAEDHSAFQTEIKLKQPENPTGILRMGSGGFTMSFLIRMLFSCLVDADFLDTECFMTKGKVQRGGYDGIQTLEARLQAYIDTNFTNPDTPVKQKRNEILHRCQALAEGERGLYTLTVPTGGGKTISSLAFALGHAKAHHMKRVIYAIPYTSIIEQNAAVFGGIVGEDNVVEHHSNIDYDNRNDEDTKDRKYLSTENWDAPVIVTTNVQFFESLFANRTSRCRKLHNIAGSVIIFDEAQMIPLPYLIPCVRAIAELVCNYGCTAVLCSATQPALGGLFPKPITATEMMEDVPGLFKFFRRARIVQEGELDDDALATRLNGSHQALCIVGTRKHAQKLFDRLEGEGRFHLSTLMTPLHRKRQIAQIRRRLAQGLPCRVVSTSLIEAGVDLDFPVVYRAQAGLDSQIQAAGRCNREGRRPLEDSVVHVFAPQQEYARHQPEPVRRLIETAKVTARQFEDVMSPDAIAHYFNTLYVFEGKEQLDQCKIVPLMEGGINGWSFPFATVAQKVKLIDNSTVPVFIPEDEQARELELRLRGGECSRSLLRKIGPYCVNVYENHLSALVNAGAVERLDTELSVLLDASAYREDIGLSLDVEEGKGYFL